MTDLKQLITSPILFFPFHIYLPFPFTLGLTSSHLTILILYALARNSNPHPSNNKLSRHKFNTPKVFWLGLQLYRRPDFLWDRMKDKTVSACINPCVSACFLVWECHCGWISFFFLCGESERQTGAKG